MKALMLFQCYLSPMSEYQCFSSFSTTTWEHFQFLLKLRRNSDPQAKKSDIKALQ